jgi:hypothetical protein
MIRKVQTKLTKLKRPIKTFKIASFDIETYGKDNKFLLGGLIDSNNVYYSFDDRNKMIYFIKDNIDKDTIIVATNLMFDFTALFYGTKYFKDAKLLLRGGGMISAKIFDITFYDTLNYSKSSVESLGRLLNLPKLVHPKFLGKMYKNKFEKYRLRIYNKRDCEISKLFLIQFQDVLNQLGCELKVTIASCSMDLYRRKYMPFDIEKEFIHEKDFIYDAYFGGRTEVFKRGINKSKDLYYLYDINSLYPSVMLNEYPLPSSCHRSGLPRVEFINNYHGVSEVTIVCPYMYYPLLPYKLDGKLCFPVGIFRGTYNHIELRKALELGYKIRKIHKQIYYTETFYPFKKYVEELYELRLKYQSENNGIYSTIVKILMNSLYGKFATKNVSEYEYVDLESNNIDNAILNKDGIGYRETPIECNQAYIIPILSSYTTSYARLILYDHLVNLEGIYCDTDSVISKKVFETSKDLGKMKLEKTFRQFNIVKPKEYYYKDLSNHYYVKIKGIKLSDKPINDFKKAIDNKYISQLRFRKLKEAIRHDELPNSIYTMKKKTDNEDNKRDWLKNKYNSKDQQNSEPQNIHLID